MADVSEERRELFSSLRVEYSIIEQKWRFLLGARIALSVFGGTLFTALFSAYQALLPTNGDVKGIASLGLGFIPLIAVASLWAISLVEHRLYHFYKTCTRRGEAVELELGITDGIYKQMRVLPRPFGGVTSGIGAYVVIALATVIWLSLLVPTLFSQ